MSGKTTNIHNDGQKSVTIVQNVTPFKINIIPVHISKEKDTHHKNIEQRIL